MADPYYCGDPRKKDDAAVAKTATPTPDSPPATADTAPTAPTGQDHASPAQDPAQVAALGELLEQLLRGCHGTTGAMIVTDDGFPIAHRLHPTADANRLAAITSSMLGLSESMAREGGHGKCDNVILENGEGNVVLMRIDRLRILTVLAAKSTRLGMLISAARKCAAAAAEPR